MITDIDVRRKGEPISPLWFGHNLEHTRSCVWQGMSAQLIRNRKFAGRPGRRGQALDWYPIGPPQTWYVLSGRRTNQARSQDAYTAHYSTDSRERTCEVQYQHIGCFATGEPCGIGQDDITLYAGRDYELRLALRSDREMPVRVEIAGEDRAQVYHGTVLGVMPGEWREHAGRFTMPCTDERARLEITYEVMGELDVGAVSLLPADHFHGMRPDVVELLRQISVPILRWPGGNFAGDYRWQDGPLPVDRRAPLAAHMETQTLPHTRGYDTHEIGTDEFIALCRELGAEPFITINLTWESPEECAAWVEYCNASQNTEWGAIRSERGHPEPYGVEYWSLGNEFGYGHMEGANAPAAYSEKAAACAEAMRGVDPSIQLVSSGIWNVDAWYTDCLEPLAPLIDHIAVHRYSPFLGSFVGDQATREFRRVATEAGENLTMLQVIRARVEDAVPDGKFVGIAFDEWNTWHAWYRIPNVSDGIYTASMLNMFCREGTNVGMTIGCFFEPVNEGAILVQPEGARLTPMGQVFRLFKAHQGNALVELAPQDPEADVDVAASVNEEQDKLIVTIVNRNPEQAKEISLVLENVGAPAAVEATQLHAGDFLPGSAFEEDELAVLVEGGVLSTVLPKHSVACIEIEF